MPLRFARRNAPGASLLRIGLLCVCLAMVGSRSFGAPAEPFEDSLPARVASRVLVATEERALRPGGAVSQEVVNRMVDSLILTLTGRHSVADAWRSLFQAQDVIGIKVSTSGGRSGGTRLETVKAVIAGLRAAGFTREQIVVWDRQKDSLLRAGFVENDASYQLRWIEGRRGETSGFDPQAVFTAPVLGQLIWGDLEFVEQARLLGGGGRGAGQFSNRSHFAKVLSREVTKVIHIPSLQDSFLTGVNGALVGMTVHNVDNWRRFAEAQGMGSAYIAGLYANELIAGRVVLTILDALRLQYAGGPFPSPAETVDYASIFMSYDPVALDMVARDLLNEVRQQKRLPKFDHLTGYIEHAAAEGLGIAERAAIQIRDVPSGTGRRAAKR